MTIGRIPSVEGGIQPTIFDAKADILTATAADTPARLAVGNNGDTIVADSAESTGLRWQGNYAAGKNKVINGDFGIWQRGTSFSNPANGAFTTDRWTLAYNGTGITSSVTQETFTPGSAPVAGYEGSYFLRHDVSVAGTGNTTRQFRQPIEDVRTFAGQTVTLSFWAKADTNRTISTYLAQIFGTGGSASVDSATKNYSVTTTWQRFTQTVTLASISGKTIGTNSNLRVVLQMPSNSTLTVDFWGVQLEAGNVSTSFQTATGTIQGELAACHRYYQLLASGNGKALGMANSYATTAFDAFIHLPVEMRTTPTLSVVSGTNYYQIYTTLATTFNDFSLGGNTTARVVGLNKTGLSGLTAGQSGLVTTNNASSSVAVSAEL